MSNTDDESSSFGVHELVAAALAVGLSVLAAPTPAASSEVHDDDWEFVWAAGLSAIALPLPSVLNAPALNFALDQQFHEPARQQKPFADFAVLDKPTQTSHLSQAIEMIPINLRYAPAPDAGQDHQRRVAVREDRWTMLSLDGVMRLSAYARGPLDAEDRSNIRTPTPFPRELGTGFGLVTATPIYIGATLKTDRSIYDIDQDRFDGARWSTSVFMGTETAFGPLYVGTTQGANGTRSAYLYLGRWF